MMKIKDDACFILNEKDPTLNIEWIGIAHTPLPGNKQCFVYTCVAGYVYGEVD